MLRAQPPDHAIAVLLGLTRELTRQTPLEDALQAVTDAALDLLPADHASIRVLDETRTELLCGARSGAGQPHRPLTFRPGQGVVGWVVEHKHIARIADTDRDARFDAPGEQGWAIRSLLVVPLWSADRVVGALGVSSPQANAFSNEDEAMALLLANCAAPPIERVRLERLSVTDPLTLAYNRRFLQPRLLEEMDRAQRYGSPLTLAALWLDPVGRLAEEHGVDLEDRALRHAADRIRAAVRRTDALVRYAECRFVLVMPHTDADQAVLVCERIGQSLAELPVAVGAGRRLPLRAAMAVACWDGRQSAKQWEAELERAATESSQAAAVGAVVVAPHRRAGSSRPPGEAR